MMKKLNAIYKNSEGEFFQCIEFNGELVLTNPKYPFNFTFEAQGQLEMVETDKTFDQLVKKEDFQFHEGPELNIEIRDGKLEVIGLPKVLLYLARDSEKWIPYDKNWEAFTNEEFCVPGVVVQFDNGKQLLVGDINVLGGSCDDCCPEECDWSGGHIVTKYAQLIEMVESKI